MLHFAAAELEEERGDGDAARATYERLVAGLVPPREAGAPEPPPALQVPGACGPACCLRAWLLLAGPSTVTHVKMYECVSYLILEPCALCIH